MIEYWLISLWLKAFSAVFFEHPIAQVFRKPQNPGFTGLNPIGGVTFFKISLIFKIN